MSWSGGLLPRAATLKEARVLQGVSRHRRDGSQVCLVCCWRESCVWWEGASDELRGAEVTENLRGQGEVGPGSATCRTAALPGGEQS